MVTKKILLIALVVVMTLFATGCGGKTEEVQVSTDGGIPVQTTPFRYFQRTRAGYDSPDNTKVLAWIEEKTGIKIELTPIANESVKERIDLMIAANEEVDGINLVGYEDSYVGLQEKNAIMPINDLLDKYGQNAKRVMASGFYSVTDKDGNIWALPRAERFPEGYIPTIRGDWLEALGMSMPTTMEEIDAYLAAVKANDMNGNGDPNDEIPLLPNGLTYGISNFIPYYLKVKDNNLTTTGFSTRHHYMAEDGTIRSIVSHPDFVNVIAKFREWYEKGYMPQDIHLLQTAQLNDIRSAATFGMQLGWYLDGSANLVDWSVANPTKPPARTDAIPPLKNAPSGRAMWPANPKTGAQIMFFRTGKNTIHMMRYFDWICADPVNNVIVNFGLENDHWHWNADKSAVVIRSDGAARYNEFYAMSSTYWEGLMPKLAAEDNPKQSAMFTLMDTIRSWKASNYPFDAHVPYTYKGTDAEFVTADGSTLIQEAIIKMVIGQMPLSEWNNVRIQYDAIEGDIYSKVWTDQYYEYTGEQRPAN